MEALLALVIGALAGAGVWLVLRPRTFQVIMGLALIGYAVNLFIFAMGSLYLDKPPILTAGASPDLVLRNAEALDIQLADIEDVILSHNHRDHTAGLLHVLASDGDTYDARHHRMLAVIASLVDRKARR